MKILKTISVVAAASFAISSHATSVGDTTPGDIAAAARGDLVLAVAGKHNDTGEQSSIIWDLFDPSGPLGDLTVLDIRQWVQGGGGRFTIFNPDIADFVQNHSEYRWNLFGVSGVQSDSESIDYGIATTMRADSPRPDNQSGNDLETNVRNQARAWLRKNIAAGLQENGTLRATPADDWFFDSPPTHGDNIFGVHATGRGGETIPFVYLRKKPGLLEDSFVFDPDFRLVEGANTLPIDIVELGDWTLGPNGALGFLVPVPGVVWLFGAAAVGLVRTRKRGS